jgi:hypothetical protein
MIPKRRVAVAVLMALLCLSDAERSRCQGDEGNLRRLKYNHPGLTVDLGVGLWAWPLPLDFNGNGQFDLVVNCPDKPSNGVYYFENPQGDLASNPVPVFRPARRISRGMQNVQVSHGATGMQVLTPGHRYPDFLQTGLEKPEPLPLPANWRANVHPRPSASEHVADGGLRWRWTR